MARWTGKRVAVLYGGRSTEREVSLKTGAACADALRQKGYDVTLVDVDLEAAARLREARADVAFVALHGRWGEDGCIQGLLESMGIPYTGSGVLASSVGMDKVLSKLLFRTLCLSVTEYVVLPRERLDAVTVADLPFGLPCVVKPSGEGSSVGVHLVKDAAALAAACRDAASFKGEVIGNPFLATCRSQTDVHISGNMEQLLEEMGGFHWMTSYGDYLSETGYALRKVGARLIDVSGSTKA